MDDLNKKQDGDTGYAAFYRGRSAGVYALNLATARGIVARAWKVRKLHEITLIVAERPDGSAVVHSTASVG